MRPTARKMTSRSVRVLVDRRHNPANDKKSNHDTRPGERMSQQVWGAKSGTSSSPAVGIQLFSLLRRVAILAAALFYVTVSIQACVASYRVLVGEVLPAAHSMPYDTNLASAAMGNSTIQLSPLVQTMLRGDTTCRNDTLYIFQSDEDQSLQASFSGCPTPTPVDNVYSNAFLRSMFSSLVKGTSYNLTFLESTSIELVAPIVDCTSSARVYEDATATRFFFLVRNIAAPKHASVLVINTSNQGVIVVSRNEMGSASVMTLALLSDMTASTVDHHFVLSLGYPFEQFDMVVYEYLEATRDTFWRLRSIPRDKRLQVSKTLLTACRSGFFVRSETEQSNINTLLWDLPSDPHLVARRLPWYAAPEMRDSWAWAHFVHAVLAWGVLYHVLVLVVLTFRNVRSRRYWIGDAFVAISSSLVFRGFLVVLSMIMNKFWAIKEFAAAEATHISTGDRIVFESITHADFLVLYFSVVGFLGKVLRQRIDPALTVALFELGFHQRHRILAWFPSLRQRLVDAGNEEFAQGIIVTEDDSSLVSPMKLWGAHELKSPSASVILAILLPILLTLVPLVVITTGNYLVRAWRRRQNAPFITVSPFGSNSSNLSSGRADESVTDIRTNFEQATGAHLADQFGLLSDYDNYMRIKGLRYASADGIYSNGFVIVNDKYLVQTQDLLTIAMIKLSGIRFRNVYAYDVDGHSVGEMARLVYPETMSYRDLINININVLT